MLGNWSFGDYFKEEAIAFAWELLTVVYGIPADRLYVTYFGGDPSLPDCPSDEEARVMWTKYLPDNHILPFDCSDNFWEMGATGPCGPCTEIHYDRIGGRDAGPLVNLDDPDVLEIWNLVFMQFNRLPNRSLEELPAKSIDTGMGFERVTSILQNKRSNYDTDCFMPLFARIQELTNAPHAYTGLIGNDDVGYVDTAYRVIADHIRTLCFAITDGAVPDSMGRGYVLRRIVRRAVRFGRQNLSAPPGFFNKMVPDVVALLGDAFPELKTKPDEVQQIIAEEEELFGRTLNKGIRMFERMVDRMQEGSKTIHGADAFKLYDTFGFPADLTLFMAEEKGLTVDQAQYDEAMKAQQEASKGSKGAAGLPAMESKETSYLAEKSVSATDDGAKYSVDVAPKSVVKAIFTADGFLETAPPGDGLVGLVVQASPFYAEQGGQIFDTGLITSDKDGEDMIFDVTNVQKFGAYVVHYGTAKGSAVSVGDEIDMQVDYVRRSFIAPNHTVTHVLNWALRKTLTDQKAIDQKGSANNERKTQFDFTCSRAMTADELSEVERLVTFQIEEKYGVYCQDSPLAEAKKISSLRAVFGETYPDPVRVVSIGAPVDELLADPENAKWAEFSVEFCGGTHTPSTAEIATFCLTREESVSRGVRRVTALTGKLAEQAIRLGDELKVKAEASAKLSGDELKAGAIALRSEVDAADISASVKLQLRDQLKAMDEVVLKAGKAASAEKGKAGMAAAAAAGLALAESGIKTLVLVVDGVGANGKMAKKAVDALVKAAPGCSVMVFFPEGSKVLCVADSKKGANGIDAASWVKPILAILGGKGGGKGDRAQGQGPAVDKLDEARAAAEAFAAAAGAGAEA